MTGAGVHRWVMVLPALLLAAATVAGCSSGGSVTATGTSSAAAPAASGSPSGRAGGFGGAAFQAYTACLTENGVTLASRSPGVRPSGVPSGRARPSGSAGGFRGGFGGGFGTTPPAGVDAKTWAKAQAACASLRPSFSPGAGRSGGGVDATALAAYVSCLSDHGVKVSGTGFAALRSLNRSDPTVAKALKTCQPLLPSAPARGSTPSPSATT